ncbi:MAG: hypothetical protein ACYCVN_12440 [Acidimicrobiales bacterium]
MEPNLDPIDVALHWPFIRRHLRFDRHRSFERVLWALACEQALVGGQPVRFGTSYWRRQWALTPGEATSAARALRDLEARRVVAGFSGFGNQGNAWTFTTSLGNWSPLPWTGSRKTVERAIRRCGCSHHGSHDPTMYLVPGQRRAASRTHARIALPDDAHLWRPGSLPVDMHHGGTERTMVGQRPGETQNSPGTGVRDKEPENSPLYPVSLSLLRKDLPSFLTLDGDEVEGTKEGGTHNGEAAAELAVQLRAAAEQIGVRFFGREYEALERLCREADDRGPELLAMVPGLRGIRHTRLIREVLAERLGRPPPMPEAPWDPVADERRRILRELRAHKLCAEPDAESITLLEEELDRLGG